VVGKQGTDGVAAAVVDNVIGNNGQHRLTG
jgi:hypothetical protein